MQRERRGKQEVTGCGRIINKKKAAMREDDLEQCEISIRKTATAQLQLTNDYKCADLISMANVAGAICSVLIKQVEKIQVG